MAFLGMIGELVSFVLCYLLPAYSSYKALRTGSRKAVIKLLMYWTVLSVFKGGEVFSDFFLGWLPLYSPLKLLFVLWLTLPQTKGYVYVYRNLIHSQFLLHEVEIDRMLLHTEATLWAYALRLQVHAIDLGRHLMTVTVNHLRRMVLEQMRNPGMALGELATQMLLAAGPDASERLELPAEPKRDSATEQAAASASAPVPLRTLAARRAASAAQNQHVDSNDSIVFLASSPLPGNGPNRPMPASLHHASPETERDLEFASPSVRRAMAQQDAGSRTPSTASDALGTIDELAPTPSDLGSWDGGDDGDDSANDENQPRGRLSGPSMAFAVDPSESDVWDEPYGDKDVSDDLRQQPWNLGNLLSPRRDLAGAGRKRGPAAPARNAAPVVAKRVSSGGKLVAMSPNIAVRRHAAATRKPLAPAAANGNPVASVSDGV